MARSYPRFLLSQSSQSKSKGTFIIHTLEPGFIAQPIFNDMRQVIDIIVLKVWQKEPFPYVTASEIANKEIPEWWKYSGIHESNDPRDLIISKLSKLEFLRQNKTAYTTEEVQEVIKIIFPTKAKTFNHEVDTYGIKHDLERISMLFIKERYFKKYCSNESVKEALIKEGFKTKQESPNSPNLIANISGPEIDLIRKIGFFRINNMSTTEAFIDK